MHKWHRVHKYSLLLTICILVISLLLPSCGGEAVEEGEEEEGEEEEEALAPTSPIEEIPSEAIIGENIITKTPLIEGTVILSSGQPAYKIGLRIEYVMPNASQTQGVYVDLTYTDREGKYRFYDNVYYSEAEYLIYHTFEGQDGTISYGYMPDAEITVEWGQTTTVPVIRLSYDETQLYASQPSPTSSITTTTEIQSQVIPSIQGMVFFTDTAKGHDVSVILRQEWDNYNILAQIKTNAQGYYAFYKIPAGVYWINTISNNYYVSNVPDAIVIVSSGSTSTVEDLSEKKDIYILSINGITPSYPRTTVEDGTVKFTWSAVENTAYYEVEIWSTYTEEHPSNKDYDYTERTSNNSFTWSMDSSALPYKDFRIDVKAYSANNILIASNYELFTVSQS